MHPFLFMVPKISYCIRSLNNFHFGNVHNFHHFWTSTGFAFLRQGEDVFLDLTIMPKQFVKFLQLKLPRILYLAKPSLCKYMYMFYFLKDLK